VSRLRKAFTTAGGRGEVIATRAPGYLVADGWLDARCFEERAKRAHDALAAGDREEAAALLGAALALWRGPALSGIDRPFAEIEAARLEERRPLVTEERIGLGRDLGRPEGPGGGPLAPVRGRPPRGRPPVPLTPALAPAGPRGEALAVYQDGRRQLVETLGIEPGQQLRAVHQALLRDESAPLRDEPPRRPGPPPGGRDDRASWRGEADRAAHGPREPAQLPP